MPFCSLANITGSCVPWNVLVGRTTWSRLAAIIGLYIDFYGGAIPFS